MTPPRPSSAERVRAALWFAERGFGVFSVWSADADGTCRCSARAACASPGKHPIGRQGFRESTRDPARIRTMLSAASEPNYGLVPPDGVLVWDVDGDGPARLAALEARLGALPPTLRTDTAHGQHVFLRWPAGLPRPIGQMFGLVTRWGSGSGAGYVVGPRSVHPSGAVYAPAGGCTDIAELPAAWAGEAIAPSRGDGGDGGTVVVGGGYELPPPGYAGARYDAVRDYAASRYMRGLSRDEVWAGVLGVLAPRFARPLPEPELRERFERAWRGTAERLGEPLGEPDGGAAAAAAAAAEARPPAGAWPGPLGDAAWHGPLGSVVASVADATEADPAGILGSLLAMAGACMGPSRYIYQGSPQTPNLFVALVGDSSTGRKGTAGSIARAVMDRAYPAWSRLVVAGLGSGEGLVGYLKAREAEGEGECRALVMESELGRLLAVMGREGSTLSPVVRDAWDGVPLGRVLAREQSVVPVHHVGIVAHVTPVELRQRLSGTDAANGFGNRFLWLAVRRTRLLPFPGSPAELVDPGLLREVGDAIAAAQRPGEVPWSAAGREAWAGVYAGLAERRRPGMLGALSARAEAQISRLALVYALLDRSHAVDAPHLAAALAVWDHAEASAAWAFGGSTGSRDADALLAHLADGPVTWEAAGRAIGVRRAAETADAVAVLEEAGLAEVVRAARPGGGRPTRWIRAARGANPANSAQGAHGGRA